MDTAPRPGSVSKYSPSFGELRPCRWLARMTSAHDRTLPYHVPTAAACAGVVHTDHATTSTTSSSRDCRCCCSQHLFKSVRIVSLVYTRTRVVCIGHFLLQHLLQDSPLATRVVYRGHFLCNTSAVADSPLVVPGTVVCIRHFFCNASTVADSPVVTLVECCLSLGHYLCTTCS